MSLRGRLSSASSVGVAAVLAFVIVACGGSVGDGASGSDAGTDGGGDGSEGGGSCTTATLPGDRACVPGIAPAGVPIEIGVDAADGCLGCFTTFDPCKVDVSGSEITVSMITRTCPPPGDQACPAICALPGTTCKLPALAAGTYTLKVTGDKARSGLPPRELVVANDPAASASCKLPMPPNDPEPLDGKKYSTSCSVDADCKLATIGNLCMPCKCPNVAIATSDSAKYAADYRAGSSQCHATSDLIACAACPPAKATCVTDPSALTGTCTIK
jgi:hypothetical protein